MKTKEELIDELIDLAFAEDIGDGDHTTLCCIPKEAMGKSHLLIKEEGILAGVELAKKVFDRFDPTMEVEVLIQDGSHVKPGDIAMVVTGKTQSLLQTERLMLNIMQRMSGIATMTNRYVERIAGTGAHVDGSTGCIRYAGSPVRDHRCLRAGLCQAPQHQRVSKDIHDLEVHTVPVGKGE